MDLSLNFIAKNYNVNDNLNILSLYNGQAKNSFEKAGKMAVGAQTTDLYMSMNPLIAKRNRMIRDKEHVARLKWLYVDLDYYHSCYKDFTKEQIIGLLELDWFGNKIPQPTYIIDSGRGLYLLWKIDEHIKAYSRWERMQKYLCNQLQEFGSDRKVATDSARVLRVIGSINSKTNTEVKILDCSERKYSLTNLLREYIISDKPSEKMIRYAKNIASALEIEEPDFADKEAVKKFIRENKEPANLFFHKNKKRVSGKGKKQGKISYIHNEYSLHKARLEDLEKLLTQFRDKEDSCREHILFLYRYSQLCICDNKELSLQKTIELNNKLHHPLDLKELVNATKSAEKYYDKGKVFRCTNEYIVQALHITAQEMQGLNFFISAHEKKERKSERNKKAYLSFLAEKGERTKRTKITLRRIRIAKLLRKNKSCDVICRQLGISRATFYADKQLIERYLAARNNRVNQQSTCLKNSAPKLYMSFRTQLELDKTSLEWYSIPVAGSNLLSCVAGSCLSIVYMRGD